MTNLFDTYLENNFCRTEGDGAVRNLEKLFEVLGYGEGFMRGRAIEEFLADNPGAVEALINFVGEWTENNDEWKEAIRDSLEQDGLLDEEEEVE